MTASSVPRGVQWQCSGIPLRHGWEVVVIVTGIRSRSTGVGQGHWDCGMTKDAFMYRQPGVLGGLVMGLHG